VDTEFSLGVIFRGIFEYPATKKNKAADGLNLTHACNAKNSTGHENTTDSDQYLLEEEEFNYFSLSEIEEWDFVSENKTFIGRVGNFTRYSIRVSFVDGYISLHCELLAMCGGYIFVLVFGKYLT